VQPNGDPSFNNTQLHTLLDKAAAANHPYSLNQGSVSVALPDGSQPPLNWEWADLKESYGTLPFCCFVGL
jgi:hypothetical protein